MSELEKLMSVIRDVIDKPENRDEFRILLYSLYKSDPALYEQTMVEMEKLAPMLQREMRDFIFNINDVKDFLRRIDERNSTSS